MTSVSRIFAVVFVSLISTAMLCGCSKSVAGTYDLDKAAIKAAAEAEAKKSDPKNPGAGMAAAMMAGMIDQMNFTLTLNADGSANMQINAGETKTVTGTYTVSGSTISLTMAEKGESPKTVTGTVSGDTITLHPPKGEDMPFDMVFRKKK